VAEKPTYEELEQRIKELEKETYERKQAENLIRAQRSLSVKLNDISSLDEGLSICLNTALNISDMECGGIYLFDKDQKALKMIYQEGLPTEFVKYASYYNSDSNNVKLIRTGKPIYSQHQKLNLPYSEAVQSENLRAIAILPISHKGQVIGCMNVASKSIDVVPDYSRGSLETIAIHIGSEVARLQSEEALRESEGRLRAIFEQAAVGVAQNETKTGRFIKINQKYCDIVGYTQEEITATTFMNITHPDDLQTDLNNMKKLKAGEIREFTIEKRYICKDDSIVWVNLTVSPMWGINEEPNYHIAVMEDITEKKLLEAQLMQTYKMESIGTLAGGIAHDFNNILGIILGNTELAIDDVTEWNPVRINLEEIRIASLRAKDVVRQLLSFARKTKMEKKPTNIIPIVKESLNLLRSSIPTSVEIRQNIKKDVAIILADPTQINQIMMNLCTNADHAMPDGGIIEVILKNVEFDEDTRGQYPDLKPGRHINLTVSDTGHGISREEVDRIFDPYFTTKDVGKGTGMGLAIVHSIVKEHDGIILVDSEPDIGTAFSIYFPVVEEEAVEESLIDGELPTGDENVLFVDDEESIVDMGCKMLERLGYQVASTTNPVEALELISSQPERFDLVVTDMAMPQMTGDKLVKDILNISPDTPIILCTGFSEKIDEKKAKEIGAADYIEKPLIMRDFALKVRKVLDDK